jgi:hypothetical protein
VPKTIVGIHTHPADDKDTPPAIHGQEAKPEVEMISSTAEAKHCLTGF